MHVLTGDRDLLEGRVAALGEIARDLLLAKGTDLTDYQLAMAAQEKAKPADCPVYLHGETDKRGDVVPRGVIHLVDAGSQTPPAIAITTRAGTPRSTSPI